MVCIIGLYLGTGEDNLSRDNIFHPIHQAEWGFSRRISRGGPVGPQDAREFFHPVALYHFQFSLQSLHDDSVCYLYLPISLRVRH